MKMDDLAETSVISLIPSATQVYGTMLLILMALIVFLGVKFVNKFAAVALFCVIGSICSIFIGIFVNFNGNDKAP